MKEQFKIKNVFTTLPILGLALLLLLSPCKVRNFIQSELDLAQTQVLNKSQSAFSQISCQDFEITTSDNTRPKQNLNISKALPLESYTTTLTEHPCKDSKIILLSDYDSTSDVPLYILYQNLKVYA